LMSINLLLKQSTAAFGIGHAYWTHAKTVACCANIRK
jgi:hypothetical protein